MHVVVVYFGIQQCLEGFINPATVFNFTVYNWEISWEIRYIVSDLIPQMVRMMEPLERLSAVLGATPRIEPHPAKLLTQGEPLKPAKFKGHIVFSDCHFRYPSALLLAAVLAARCWLPASFADAGISSMTAEKQKPVLRGISFEVLPGQKVAFVGKTGCGKSTSVNLLQQLYQVLSRLWGTPPLDCGQCCVPISGEFAVVCTIHYLRWTQAR
jgi:ABC-type multidrug transport system fused ATPase/permease subunit|eukprot:SAG25_NODE_2933_length_1309_cov_1.403306_2_plen_212_part_00